MAESNETGNKNVLTERFEKMIKYYLESNPLSREDKKIDELEVRFGINEEKSKPISKNDYENVIKQLHSSGFTTANPKGMHSLRIFTEYRDPAGMVKMSNIRTEIVGVDLIQEYCRSNSIQKILDLPSSTYDKIKFTQKTPMKDDTGANLKSVDFFDHNFRVAYQLEQVSTARSGFIREKILRNWDNNKKTFRHLNRVQFKHKDATFPILADLSIVKNSVRTKSRMVNGKWVKGIAIPKYTIQEAEVFKNVETYEIELEIDNSKVGKGTNYDTIDKIMGALRKCIRIVLSGLQGSNYPIPFSERDEVLNNYMNLINGIDQEDKDEEKPTEKPEEGEIQQENESNEAAPSKKWRVEPKNFIGPSSLTLQIENISEIQDGSNIPNIRTNYTVTDKADGERKLLFVNKNGKIYLIDTNMNVIFTGAVTKNKMLFRSLIDGEHIKYNKKNRYINLYAAFDIYYIRGKSIREFGFYPSANEEDLSKFRLPILNTFIEKLEHISVLKQDTREKSTEKSSCDFVVQTKTFYATSETQTIFEACSNIITKNNDNDDLFDYNTDGLIFTPTNTGVGSDVIGKSGPIYKSTWDLSFKWKPAHYNTIDFLVKIKKDKKGNDEVHNVFTEGVNLEGIQKVKQYKILELHCGFDQKKHGYLQPFQDILEGRAPTPSDVDNNDSYQPKLFKPTNPYDPNACYCNVYLNEDGNGDLLLFTEENEYFEGDMIVEFRYEMNNDEGWKWIPLRVRYDKTNELLAGNKNYGNAYHVANSNWNSIHNPITETMIMSGENIPQTISNEEVYYNRSGKKFNTRSLRDFHNLFVKKKLISAVSKRGNTLIDYAVGKAGDLSKWINAKLSFVFGIDISKDNIHNPLDGACARYLSSKRKFHNMFDGIFVTGNTGMNIRDGSAMPTELGLEKDRQVTRAIFGNGPKDYKIIGKGVVEKYGIGKDGFNVSSCQFAMHYMFGTRDTVHAFMRNLAECTKMNGYFIGTCYDGKRIFEMLKNKAEGEGITIVRDNSKIFELTKKYNQTGFPDDEMSIGYPINVYQETINKTFIEYLVNKNYLIRIMEDYGFVLLPKEEAKQIGLLNSMGSFKELFDSMKEDISMHPRNRDEYGTAENMTTDEKTISFLNMYFVFKKMRSLTLQQLNRIYNYNSDVLEEPMIEQDSETVKPPKHIVRKLKRPKITIATTEPIVMPMIEKKQEKKDEDKTAKKEEEKPKEENVVEEPEEEVPEEKAEEKPKEEEEVVNAEEEIIIVKPKKIKKTSKK
jgi:hypothetical protein